MNPYLWTSITILSGIAIVLLALWWNTPTGSLSGLFHLLNKFLENLGVSLLILGIIGILLEFRDWKEYFRERLSEIIVKKDYLKKLDQGELVRLQTDTLKAFFKTDDIDREGSFLNFFHNKIQGYIGSPYRQNYYDSIVIEEYKEDDKYWKVTEVSTYTCRQVGGTIQDSVY